MTVRRWARRATAVIASTTALVLLSAAPAFAVKVQAKQGSDYASLETDDYWVEVCDMENDGNGVYAQFSDTGGGWETVGDANGSAGGCGNDYVDFRVDRFKVCESDLLQDSCSAWKPIPGAT